jgi:predicted  nucleic acid-binding Zn-ribbon protein
VTTHDVLYVIGLAVTGLATYLGVRLTARVSQKATDTTAVLSKEANAISGFHQLVGDLQRSFDQLREDHNKLRHEHNELQRHVAKLEEQRDRDKSLIRLLISYVTTLRDTLRREQLPIPDAPAGLDLDGGPLR